MGTDACEVTLCLSQGGGGGQPYVGRIRMGVRKTCRKTGLVRPARGDLAGRPGHWTCRATAQRGANGKGFLGVSNWRSLWGTRRWQPPGGGGGAQSSGTTAAENSAAGHLIERL